MEDRWKDRNVDRQIGMGIVRQTDEQLYLMKNVRDHRTLQNKNENSIKFEQKQQQRNQ